MRVTSNHELLRIRSSTVPNRFYYIILNAYAINKIYMQIVCFEMRSIIT